MIRLRGTSYGQAICSAYWRTVGVGMRISDAGSTLRGRIQRGACLNGKSADDAEHIAREQGNAHALHLRQQVHGHPLNEGDREYERSAEGVWPHAYLHHWKHSFDGNNQFHQRRTWWTDNHKHRRHYTCHVCLRRRSGGRRRRSLHTAGWGGSSIPALRSTCRSSISRSSTKASYRRSPSQAWRC